MEKVVLTRGWLLVSGSLTQKYEQDIVETWSQSRGGPSEEVPQEAEKLERF